MLETDGYLRRFITEANAQEISRITGGALVVPLEDDGFTFQILWLFSETLMTFLQLTVLLTLRVETQRNIMTLVCE